LIWPWLILLLNGGNALTKVKCLYGLCKAVNKPREIIRLFWFLFTISQTANNTMQNPQLH